MKPWSFPEKPYPKWPVFRRSDVAGFGGSLTAIDDEKLKAEIARFACVLASAYLEVSCEEILDLYSSARADPTVTWYVNSQLYYFQNPTLGKILQLAGPFDPVRRQALETILSDPMKDSVGSIMGNRNNIAHGHDSSITLTRLKTYYADAKKLLGYFEAEFPARK